MSGNTRKKAASATKRRKGTMDRRIVRTRDMLGEALVKLMLERPFEQITVKQLLCRAGVGRSTFYAHFRNKDELFRSDVEDFCQALGEFLKRKGADPGRVAPVAEFFAHVRDVKDFHEALVSSGKDDDVREIGTRYLAQSVEERLLTAGVTMNPAELRAASQLLAGGIFSLLDWWVRDGMTIPPEEMDAIFHRTLWNGLAVTAPDAGRGTP